MRVDYCCEALETLQYLHPFGYSKFTTGRGESWIRVFLEFLKENGEFDTYEIQHCPFCGDKLTVDMY